MANIVTDPSFETNDPAWTWLGPAERRNDLGAKSGAWNAKLYAAKGAFGGDQGSQIIQASIPGATLGEDRFLTYWCRCVDQGPTQLVPSIDYGYGYNTQQLPPPTSDWTFMVAGCVPMDTETPSIAFSLPIPGSLGDGYWEIDSVGLVLESDLPMEAMMQRGRLSSYAALLTTLAGINGASGGYYYTLTSRVFNTWKEPGELGDQLNSPYLCVPLDEPMTIDMQEKHVARATWRQNIYGYVPETSTTPMTSAASTAILKLQDDVLRALMADLTLGEKVRGMTVVSAEPISGLGDDHAFVHIVLEFNEWFTRDQLGPDA